jgi:uncharacterized protein
MPDLPVALIAGDGATIPGIEHRTTPDASVAVLLLHGITTSKDEYQGTFRSLAHTLGSHGVASLRIDFRGHGDSELPADEFTVNHQVIDVVAATGWLAAEYPNARRRILAASFGAPAAITVASLLGDALDALVLLAPVLDFHRTFVEPTTPWGHETFGRERILGTLRGGRLQVDQLALSAAFAADLLTTDPRPALKTVAAQTTILHGELDGMVPYEPSRVAAAASPNISFHSMPHTGHGLAEVGDEQRTSPQTQANVAWLVERLAGHGR